MLNNLALDENGDLSMGAGQIKQVTALDAVGQSITSDLRTFAGEYWLDYTLGVPYIEEVFKKTNDLSLINSIFKSQILKNIHILEIVSYSGKYYGEQRLFRIKVSLKTTEGIISGLEIEL